MVEFVLLKIARACIKESLPMTSFRWKCIALVALAALAGLVAHQGSAAPPTTAPVVGIKENTPAVYALVNLRIIPEPARTIDKGTIVIRDGVIEAVGADVKPPADA